MKKIILLLFFLNICVLSSFSEDWITVSDMSKLQWQMAPDGKVFLRNLHLFNSEALHTHCYHYYIDTTSVAGKSLWAVVLLKIATSEELILGVADITQGGPITYCGNW